MIATPVGVFTVTVEPCTIIGTCCPSSVLRVICAMPLLDTRGEYARAEAIGLEAVALAERTDSLLNQAITLWDLGEVLHAAGRTDEAVAALEQALDCEVRKGNLALAKQLQSRLAELQEPVTI